MNECRTDPPAVQEGKPAERLAFGVAFIRSRVTGLAESASAQSALTSVR